MQRRRVARLGLLVQRLGTNPFALHLGQRRREFAQHLRIRALLLFVRLDDAFLARVGIQFLLRILELHLDLRQAFLQEGARIGGRLHAPFQAQVDECHRNRICDARGHFRFRAVEMHLDQPGVAHRRDRQLARQAAQQAGFHFLRLRRRGLVAFLPENIQPTAALVVRPGRGDQVELLDHALRQCLALQQFVLRLQEIHAFVGRLVRRNALDGDHLGFLLFDLQRQRGAIDLGRQESGRHHRHDDDGKAGQHRPLAPDDDIPVFAQADRIILRPAGGMLVMNGHARQLVGPLDQRTAAARIGVTGFRFVGGVI